MKVVYIAHPIAGDVIGNLKKIERIVRMININEPEILPFVPYYADCKAMYDNIEAERQRGIKNNTALLKMGFVDEIRLYGDRISKGMKAEIELCRDLGIEVKAITLGTKTDLRKI